VPRPILERNTLWSSPSSCFSCSPPKVLCAAASVTLGWRSAPSTLPPGPSAFARYGPNHSRALEIDRSFQISMRKEVLRAAALTAIKLPFSHCIFDRCRVRNRPAVGNGGEQWRFGGRTGLSGWRYNFEESFRCRSAAGTATGDYPIQFMIVAPTRGLDPFFATALAARTRWWNKAGTCGSAPLRCCGT
jgi:hypothetical protein